MEEKILVPALGESITEATVAKWLKSVGDTVKADEPIVELEEPFYMKKNIKIARGWLTNYN